MIYIPLFVLTVTAIDLSTCTGTGQLCSTSGISMRNNVTFDDKFVYITSTGCPNYDYSGETTPGTARIHSLSWILPRYPRISNTVTFVGIKDLSGGNISNPLMGAMGLAANGVIIYGNSDAEGRDAYIYESHSFDETGGHADPSDTYHYHDMLMYILIPLEFHILLFLQSCKMVFLCTVLMVIMVLLLQI